MIVYHINTKIIQVNYDRDEFSWQNTTNNAEVLEVDEITPNNKDICIELMRYQNRVDINGLGKYYVLAGDLYEREGWQEFIEEFM